MQRFAIARTHEGDRAPLTPVVPPVAPVPPGISRPFWSVMIPSYDCGPYLRRTLASVLAQDPGPREMQIEVVDDASPHDDPETVLREFAPRVTLYRHERNLGATATFNTCVQRARGEWIHILHGDDLVRPAFYDAFARAIRTEATVGAVFCQTVIIDDDDREIERFPREGTASGLVPDYLERLGVWSRIQPPAIVVRRAAYEALGGFDTRLVHAADWEMWQRVVSRWPIWYEDAPLACYRRRQGSDTARLLRTGENIADIRRAIAIARAHRPPGAAVRIQRAALLFYAETAIWHAKRFRALGDRPAARAQLREAMRCYRSAGHHRAALRLVRSLIALRIRG